MVNLFLALRVVVPKSAFVRCLARAAALVYIVVCVVNWSLQLIALTASALSLDGLGPPTWGLLVWALSMVPLVQDDVVLMQWLATFDPIAEERKARIREKVEARAKQMCAAPGPHETWERLGKEAKRELRALAKREVLQQEAALDTLVDALKGAKGSLNKEA
jgi:hypothetical protein